MPSAVIFELPATQEGIILKGHPPLVVMTTGYTVEGHPDGTSTKLSFVSDHRGNRGITDSGMTSYRFDVPVTEFIEKDARGEQIDLRGKVAHRD